MNFSFRTNQQKLPNLSAHSQALPSESNNITRNDSTKSHKGKSSWFSKSNRRSIRALFSASPQPREGERDLWAPPGHQEPAYQVSQELEGVLKFLLTEETLEFERGVEGWDQGVKHGFKRGSESNSSNHSIGWNKSNPDCLFGYSESPVSFSSDVKRSKIENSECSDSQLSCSASPDSPVRTLSPTLRNKNNKTRGYKSAGKRTPNSGKRNNVAEETKPVQIVLNPQQACSNQNKMGSYNDMEDVESKEIVEDFGVDNSRCHLTNNLNIHLNHPSSDRITDNVEHNTETTLHDLDTPEAAQDDSRASAAAATSTAAAAAVAESKLCSCEEVCAENEQSSEQQFDKQRDNIRIQSNKALSESTPQQSRDFSTIECEIVSDLISSSSVSNISSELQNCDRSIGADNSNISDMEEDIQTSQCSRNDKRNESIYDGEFLRPNFNYNSLNWKHKIKTDSSTSSSVHKVSSFSHHAHESVNTNSSFQIRNVDKMDECDNQERHLYDNGDEIRWEVKHPKGLVKSNTFTSFGESVKDIRNKSSDKKKKNHPERYSFEGPDDDIGSFSSVSRSDSSSSVNSGSFFSRLKGALFRRDGKKSGVSRSESNTSKDRGSLSASDMSGKYSADRASCDNNLSSKPSFLKIFTREGSKKKQKKAQKVEEEASRSSNNRKSEIEKLAQLADSIAVQKAKENSEFLTKLGNSDICGGKCCDSAARRALTSDLVKSSDYTPLAGRVRNASCYEMSSYMTGCQCCCHRDESSSIDKHEESPYCSAVSSKFSLSNSLYQPLQLHTGYPRGASGVTHTTNVEIHHQNKEFRNSLPVTELNPENMNHSQALADIMENVNSSDDRDKNQSLDQYYNSRYLTWPPKGFRKMCGPNFSAIAESSSPSKGHTPSSFNKTIHLLAPADTEMKEADRPSSPGKRSYQEFIDNDTDDNMQGLRNDLPLHNRVKLFKRDDLCKTDQLTFSPRHNSFKGTERSSIALRTFSKNANYKVLQNGEDRTLASHAEGQYKDLLNLTRTATTAKMSLQNDQDSIKEKYKLSSYENKSIVAKDFSTNPSNYNYQKINLNKVIGTLNNSEKTEHLMTDDHSTQVSSERNANLARLEEAELNLQLLLQDDSDSRSLSNSQKGINEQYVNQSAVFLQKSGLTCKPMSLSMINTASSATNAHSGFSSAMYTMTGDTVNNDRQLNINKVLEKKSDKQNSGMKHSITFPVEPFNEVSGNRTQRSAEKKKRVSFHPLLLQESISPITDDPPPVPPPPAPLSLASYARSRKAPPPPPPRRNLAPVSESYSQSNAGNSQTMTVNKNNDLGLPFHQRMSWRGDGDPSHEHGLMIHRQGGSQPGAKRQKVSELSDEMNRENGTDLNELSDKLDKESKDLQSIIDSLRATTISDKYDNLSKAQNENTTLVDRGLSSERESPYEQIMNWFEWSDMVKKAESNGPVKEFHSGEAKYNNVARNEEIGIDKSENSANYVFLGQLINGGTNKSKIEQSSNGDGDRNTFNGLFNNERPECEGSKLQLFHCSNKTLPCTKSRVCPDYVALDVVIDKNKTKPVIPPKPLKSNYVKSSSSDVTADSNYITEGSNYVMIDDWLSEHTRRGSDDRTITSLSSSDDSIQTLTDLVIKEDFDVTSADLISHYRSQVLPHSRPKRSNSSPSLTPDLERHREAGIVQKSGSEICCVRSSVAESNSFTKLAEVEGNKFCFTDHTPSSQYFRRSATGHGKHLVDRKESYLRSSDCGLFLSSGESVYEPALDNAGCGPALVEDDGMLRTSCASPCTSSGFGSAVVLCPSEGPSSPK